MSTSFLAPERIISGDGALSASAAYLAEMGKKALVVTGKTVVTLDCFKELTDILKQNNIGYTVFDGITGEPDDKMIDAGLECYKSNGCDFIIGIGGGSPLDSMKAIAALADNGGKIADYMGKTIPHCKIKMAAIPTTAGTGSETTQFTIITDSEKDIKMLLKGECLIPRLAVVDGSLTVSSPKGITASTGLDALTHAVESYTSRKAQPLTDALALSAVKRIFKYLPVAYCDGNDITARNQMAVAALEAGLCINNASVTVVHGMSRPIGALFHVPHGLSNAMLLTKCMSFAVDGAYEKFADLGKAIGCASKSDSDIDAANKFVAALGEICSVCNVPTPSEYGIVREDFMGAIDKMAYDAIASGSPSNTIKSVGEDDVKAIYRSLWD